MFRCLIVLAVLLLAADAEACLRCRVSSCRGTPCSYVKPVVAAAPVVASTDVFVIQQNYPAPLVGQGTSALVSNGGYQSSVLPLFDPNQYFSQSLQLMRAANDVNALQAERTSSLVQRVAELQAPAVERLAAGQAASSVLRAAGLDPAHNTQGGSSAVVINRDSNGQLQVLPISTEQVQSLTSRVTTATAAVNTTITKSIASTTPQAVGDTASKYPLFTQHCARCHGIDVAQPGGGLYLGDDPNVAAAMKGRWYDIEHDINSGKMPKAAQAPLTPEEKRGVALELDAMIQSALTVSPPSP